MTVVSNSVVWQGIVVIIILFPVFRLWQLSQPLEFVIPNALLFTSFRELTRKFWFKHAKIDTRIRYEPRGIPIINAEDYSMDGINCCHHCNF